MNNFLLKPTSFLLSIATLAVVTNGLSTQAQATDFTTVDSTTAHTSDTQALTSASALRAEPSESAAAQGDTIPSTTPDITAQATDGLAPGRATRSGPSYIGIGGNIGLTGDTTLGEGAFSVFSKIGLTNYLSVRPAALIGDNTVILIPATFDFALTPGETLDASIAPYLGGGIAISTGRDDTIGGLISGGVDVPLSPQFTATAGVNIGFINETDVGLLLGVGYNF